MEQFTEVGTLPAFRSTTTTVCMYYIVLFLFYRRKDDAKAGTASTSVLFLHPNTMRAYRRLLLAALACPLPG